ncbi:MAG TPA: ammonium transporter [Spirochaetota bacterium]|nr:ammonium transporter [Spirochaetota bacterium]HQO00870.1 ammonium transporter [Spirochaetota bacterium]HQP47684.1 ammonium transporter [Spirochaetota bacterium]
MLKRTIIGAAIILAAASTGAFAQDTAAAATSSIKPINVVWTLLAAFLVFFMQAGFAMVETGFTRAKNAGNIIMKNLMDFAVGSIAFFVIGYGIMFGADAAGLFGTDKFFLSSASPANPDGLWQFAFWLFQVVFAATAATIVSGAMAERTKFVSYLIYSLLISAVIYPISGHWIWGGGWLSTMGFIDFAGSTVVHSVGGWAAMMGAILLGPRIGKYTAAGKPKAIPGHNIPLAALGVFILWFGWFGFNAGSTTAGDNLSIAFIAVNTNLAAAAGAITAMVTIWIKSGKPDVSMSLNGALAGLVAITAGCSAVSPMSSIIIGIIAGFIVVLSVELFDFALKIDDPVGAISVHGVCGAVGTLLVGVFAEAQYAGAGINGLLYGGGFRLLGIQAIGVFTVMAWVVVTCGLIFLIIKKTIGLRVTREEELKGLDIDEHGMESYAGFQIFKTQ